MAPPEDTDLPRNVRWELARIRKFPAVVADSLRFESSETGVAKICFDFQTDQLIDGSPVASIEDVEPVIFGYTSAGTIGRLAPSVSSGRDTFPQDLLHLNPTVENRPVSICLARAGLQAVYDVHGVTGVLSRLGDWFADAKAETLFEDGWEPVPSALMADCVLGYIDAEKLQRHAAANSIGGYGYISAALTRDKENAVFLQAATPVLDTNDLEQLALVRRGMAAFNKNGLPFHTSIPAVFCWPPVDRIDERPHFHRWTTIEAILSGLQDTGLLSAFEEATLKFDILFRADQQNDPKPDADKNGQRAFMLIVGLWRPAPLDETIVGVAKDPPANKLELRAFYLQRPLEDDNYTSKNTVVRQFYGLTPATPSILEAVSGEEALSRVTLLGAGALGSAFLDYAVRGGTRSLCVVDNDRLLAHNLARHKAERIHVMHRKSEVAAALCVGRAQDVSVKPVSKDVLGMSDGEFDDAISESELVFDATADPVVRRYLSREVGGDVNLVRSEIVYDGRLGLSFFTKMNSLHTLTMLYRQLIALAVNDEAIRSWIYFDTNRTFTDDELILGFGCRSLTTKMPSYKVDAHASAAFAFARASISSKAGPFIGLNYLGEDGLPQGFRMISPDPIEVFFGEEGLGDWKVKVSKGVLDRIHHWRSEMSPNETGGYLFGSIDETTLEVCVVAASPEPPGTVASPEKVVIGRWGRTPFEQVLVRRSGGRLPPIGTWHSHPQSTAEASSTDWATLDKFKQLDLQSGLPTIMLISGAGEDRAYVVEP